MPTSVGPDHTDAARLAAVTRQRLQHARGCARRHPSTRWAQSAALTLSGLGDAELGDRSEQQKSPLGVKPASFVVDHLLVQHVEQAPRTRFAATPRSSPSVEPCDGTLCFRRLPKCLSCRSRTSGRGAASGASSASAATTKRTPERWASRSIATRRSTSPRPPQHYVPSGATVPYPPGTGNYHYEMELVVVIGAPAFRVPRRRAPGGGVRLRLRARHDPPRPAARRARSSAGRGISARTSKSRRSWPRSCPRPKCGHPRSGRHRAARQRRNEAAVRPVAAHSWCARGRRASVDVLPSAAG